MPTSVDVNQVNEILREVGRDAFRDPALRPLLLDPPSVMGVESLGLDQVNVRMVARTLPGKQFEVGRDLRARVVAGLPRRGLSVPPPTADETAVLAREGDAMTEPTGRPAAGAHRPRSATARAATLAAGRAGCPRRLGRARTSTVVLAVLFLAIGTLWINVRPTPDAPAGDHRRRAAGHRPATPDVPTPTEPTTEPDDRHREPAPTTRPPEPTDSPPTTADDVEPPTSPPRRRPHPGSRPTTDRTDRAPRRTTATDAHRLTRAGRDRSLERPRRAQKLVTTAIAGLPADVDQRGSGLVPGRAAG